MTQLLKFVSPILSQIYDETEGRAKIDTIYSTTIETINKITFFIK